MGSGMTTPPSQRQVHDEAGRDAHEDVSADERVTQSARKQPGPRDEGVRPGPSNLGLEGDVVEPADAGPLNRLSVAHEPEVDEVVERRREVDADLERHVSGEGAEDGDPEGAAAITPLQAEVPNRERDDPDGDRQGEQQDRA